jgi:fatty-acyl-CoA synthase
VARTLSGAFDAAAAEFPQRAFFITRDRTWTYRAMQEWSRDIGSGLIARGLRPGDHVAVMLANYGEFAAVKLALSRIGAVAVPVNFLLRSHELEYILRQSDARALFIMEEFRGMNYFAMLEQIIPGWTRHGGGATLPKLENIVVLPREEANGWDGVSTIDTLALGGTSGSDEKLARREEEGDPMSWSDVIYTSGTTGRPKGSMCTHDMVVRGAYSSAFSRAMEDGRRMTFALPMYHVFGYVECMVACTFVGGGVIPHVAFDAARLLADAELFRASEIVGVPLMTAALLEVAEERGFDSSSVVAVFNSGGLSPPWIWKRIREVLGGEEICVGYGMTETTVSATCVLPEDEDWVRLETHGRLKLAGVAGGGLPGGRLAEYRVADAVTNEPIPRGQRGELQCRGYIVTRGYYNKPEETTAAFTEDGWFKTGDIGDIDEGGYLTLRGRFKEAYRCGGEMVMPKELEDVINEHPKVKASYVVGVPDEKMGEVGCVCIVPASSEHVAPEEIIDLCRENLARFKVPKHVIFVTAEEVPMTPTQRPQKFKLLELAKTRLAGDSAAHEG